MNATQSRNASINGNPGFSPDNVRKAPAQTSLEQRIQDRWAELTRTALRKSSGYEREVCRRLRIKQDDQTHWDARWRHDTIEIKKGRGHFWIDLIRLARAYTSQDRKLSRTRYAMLIMGKDKRVEELVLVESQTLFAFFRMGEVAAEILLLDAKLPCSRNFQQRLTARMVRDFGEVVARRMA